MPCSHDSRECILEISVQGQWKAELWRCHQCNVTLSVKEQDVGDFLRDNPAPCDELDGGSRHDGGPDDVDSVNSLIGTLKS